MELSQRRRGLFGKRESGLPKEYQKVEYIESTGEQVINLNIDPRGSDSTDHFKMYIKMRPSIAKKSDNYFFGANGDYFTFEYYDIPNRGYYYNFGNSTVLLPHNKNVGGEDVEYLITCDSGIATVTGTYDGTANYTSRIGKGPLGIFSRYNKDYYSTMRLYQLQFWQGESYPCIGEYIPCYRKFDNKPGLYDIVTKTFYTNQGTGEFLVGPDVN